MHVCNIIITFEKEIKDMKTFINSIEQATGLTFNKSFSGSESYYCNERRIRISDHFSKYTERMMDTFDDDTALDLVFRHGEYDLSFALKMINKEEFFNKLNENVEIEHVRTDIVGEIKFISCDVKEGLINVLKINENRVVNYCFSKINIK